MATSSKTPPDLADLHAAAGRIAPHVHRTPIARCTAIDRIAGAEIHFKCENLQKVGAFKARGATNAVLSLDEAEAAAGVATHSSGNHAAALARAAAIRGVPAHIVMPRTAPKVKQRAVEGYGGIITRCEPTLAARESTLARIQKETGATFIHPYDDTRVVAGQGTAALELLADAPDLDAVIAPVGGGGLASGTAIAVQETAPGAPVYGAEPAGADDAARSLEAGRLIPSVEPRTVADGLLTSLSPLTFGILRSRLETILTVSEASILTALRLILERAKLVVEPSAAVPLAAVLENPALFAGKRIGIILSGGNLDLDRLPWTVSP